jgi:NTE family protein
MSSPRIGLALGGGGARGWAHIGVLRALEQAGIKIDLVCGTSVGALVGALYLAGRLDALENWALGLSRLRIAGYLDFRVGGGMISGNRLTAALREHLGDLTIEQLPVPFACVATDLLTGHEVWLREGNLVEMLRASFSLPGLFSPVEVDGRWLVDGALVNPLPVSVCRAMGAHLVIAVDLNADPVGRIRLPGQRIPKAVGFELMPGLHQMQGKINNGLGAWMRKLFGREPDSPSLFGAMVQSLNILLDRVTRSRLAGEPPDITISPRVGHIGLLEFDRTAEVIAEGTAAAERQRPLLAEITSLIGNSRPSV